MKTFKFLNGIEEQPDRPVLDNEQVIRFWNDGDYHNILYERVIAWARGIHVFADNWIQRELAKQLNFNSELIISFYKDGQGFVDNT